MRSTSTLLLALLFVVGCPESVPEHDHSKAHPAGHDHHEEGHGHGDVPTVGITAFSDRFELFCEHPSAVVGVSVPFLVHITVLDDFSALEGATLKLALAGPEVLRATTNENLRPGIFGLEVTPTKVGTYTGSLRIEGKVSGTIENIDLVVHADIASARAAVGDHEDAGKVTFLKEQQWVVPFQTDFAGMGSVVTSVQVAGRVDTPPGGSADVSAPVT